MCKVRPIVSRCGSPTEKVAWLVTKILSPLLDYIPCHLQNIHTHITTLSELSAEQLQGWKFCSADVSALYTNVDIAGCIDDLMEFATEHKDKLNLLGLNLTDLHEMLDVVFGNAYFTFDNRLYLQLVGLFMG